MPDNSRLIREIETMPDDVRDHLLKRNLMAEYEARPDYQRNDYLRWIAGAKRDPTRRKRIDQMLDELARGGVYMNMRHRPSG